MKLASLVDILELCEALERRFDYGKKVAARVLGFDKFEEFTSIVERITKAVAELDLISLDTTNIYAKEMMKTIKKYSSEVRELRKDTVATNDDLFELSKNFRKEISTICSLIENDGVKVKDWVLKQSLQKPVSDDVIYKVAKLFKATRGVSIFDGEMRKGSNLLAFKKNMDAPKVVAYGTYHDIESCQFAKDKGIDEVAKQGIIRMSNNTFDIVLYLRNKFFYESSESYFRARRDELDFREFLSEKYVKSGGYIIFNLPCSRLPYFLPKINNLRVEAIFRTDDAMENLIFVATFRQPDLTSQIKNLKRAYLMPSKLPHIDEAEDKFFINKGELVLPEIFKAKLVDERDIFDAFADEVDSLDFIESLYKPKERVIELNQPLQEYRIGHIPAVATTELTNGIYDTSLHSDLVPEGVNYPHIFSAKIIQQEVADEEEEMHNGVMVQVISVKKRNVIVIKTMTPDGKIGNLLNTNQ